jgi:hypothetical protein
VSAFAVVDTALLFAISASSFDAFTERARPHVN